MADTDKMYTSVAAEKKKMQLLKGELDALDGSKADKATVAAGSYNKVTVNSQGIVTAGENPTTLAGHGIQDAYTKTEVNGLVDTPHQNYVTVQATDQTTAATDVLPASGQAADTIYRVSNWDGSANNGAGAFDVTVYSEYAWDDVSNPNKYVFLAVKTQIGEVFDISVYNNNATYPDLSAALGTNGANVPADIRRGGMSVKFVHSVDNKYIQYRYMSSSTAVADFINVANWQGVDDNLIFGSHNLVESVGVLKKISIFNSNTPVDYINDILEVWLSNMPAGRVGLKCLSNYAYLLSLDNNIFSRVNIANASNNIPYPVAVYFGATAEYPNGTVVGYIMFRDVASFKGKSTSNTFENINRDYCENYENSPFIAANLGLVGIKAKDATNATNVVASTTKHSSFVKELYLFGSGVDTSKTYKILIVARNHSTDKWGIAINDGTNVVSYLRKQPTEPGNILLIPAFNNSGVQAYAIVNWDEFEDGSSNTVDITLLPRVFDINYSPIIQEYLNRVNDVNNAREIEKTDFNEISSKVFSDYLSETSTFLLSDGITSSEMLHAFLKDFKMLIPKEEGYQYGILKVNNGLPNNVPYKYAIVVYKWPEDTIPTSSNVTNVAYYHTGSNPQNGKIVIENNAEVVVDWSALTSTFGGSGNFDGCGTGLRYNQDYIFGTDKSLEARIKKIEETTINNNIDVCVPDTINAIVGDTLQLYYRSIFKCVGFENYAVSVVCNIGAQYPRYYEVTPLAGDVGSHDITFTIKDNNNNILGTKKVSLVVTSVSQSPSSELNILCLGASATQGGQWASEFKRRLVGNGGTPAGNALSNIRFVGRMDITFEEKQVNLEATGGYSFPAYTNTNTSLYRFNVTAQNEPEINVGDVYSNNGYNYTITEINITEGQGGYFSCTGSGSPTSSGTLTKVSGTGSETITFSSTSHSGNPFVYNGAIDMQQYADDYCNPQQAAHGRIDVIYTELFGNGTSPYTNDFTSRMSQMQTFITQVRSVFPNCKFCIGLSWNPDLKGGMGVNYGAAGGWSDVHGIIYSNMGLCNALQKYITDNNLSDYVYILNWLNEFDEENDFRQTTKPVNTRSSVTEIFGVNGVHPATVGYYQMADTAWRLFVAKFCQS